jgi:hypothetical protein
MLSEAGSSVSIVFSDGLDERAIEVRSRQRRKDFSSSVSVQTGSGTPVQWAKARPWRDADHSPQTTAEVINE